MDRGADLERLRELSKTYAQKAHDLQVLIKDLESKTTSSEGYWKGPKADRFRHDWHDVKPTFSKWVDTLTEASKSAKTSADNIERAT
ncbi:MULTISPECIES: WXG100 family type VII secretion target [unclassified Streptomyces]|uniref:WXG100 family type VII secretion target n=1 Tax=unclassified Streptomyces TaxID=2593676 RepID=UPI0038186B97